YNRLPVDKLPIVKTILFVLFAGFLVFGAIRFCYQWLTYGVYQRLLYGIRYKLNAGERLWLWQIVLLAPVPLFVIHVVDQKDIRRYEHMDEKEIMELKLRYYEGVELEIRSHARDVALPARIDPVCTYVWTYVLEPPFRMIWMAFLCFHLPCIFWFIQGAIAFVASRGFFLWLKTPASF